MCPAWSDIRNYDLFLPVMVMNVKCYSRNFDLLKFHHSQF